MRKIIFSFFIIISPFLSYAQLNVNNSTIRILKVTFNKTETEPKDIKNTFEEIAVRITADILIIDDEIYKVVFIVKKRYTNVFRIYYREEMSDKLSDYPEMIQSVEYYSADKTLKKIISQGNEIVYINYILE